MGRTMTVAAVVLTATVAMGPAARAQTPAMSDKDKMMEKSGAMGDKMDKGKMEKDKMMDKGEMDKAKMKKDTMEKDKMMDKGMGQDKDKMMERKP